MIRAVPKEGLVRDDGFREFVRSLPCLLADRDPCECGKYIHVGSRRMVTEACHVRTKRLGGDKANIVPLCSSHHREQHAKGIKTFQRMYGFDLKAIAVELWDAYQRVTDAR